MNRHRLKRGTKYSQAGIKSVDENSNQSEEKNLWNNWRLVIQCNKCTCTNVIVQKAYSNFIFGIADV